MFLFIHSLVVNKRSQELKEGEVDDLWNSSMVGESMNDETGKINASNRSSALE
jgi:hypothetical protein